MVGALATMIATAMALFTEPAVGAPPAVTENVVAYTVDGEWLTRWSPEGETVWTKHVGGFAMESATVEANDEIRVTGTAAGPVAFGGRSLLVLAEPRTVVVRFAGDGAYLDHKLR